jgi:hypothetical protein
MNDLMSGWRHIFRDLSGSGGSLLATGAVMKKLNCVTGCIMEVNL